MNARKLSDGEMGSNEMLTIELFSHSQLGHEARERTGDSTSIVDRHPRLGTKDQYHCRAFHKRH